MKFKKFYDGLIVYCEDEEQFNTLKAEAEKRGYEIDNTKKYCKNKSDTLAFHGNEDNTKSRYYGPVELPAKEVTMLWRGWYEPDNHKILNFSDITIETKTNKEEIEVSKIQDVIEKLKELEKQNRDRASELREKDKKNPNNSDHDNSCLSTGRSIAFMVAIMQLEMALQENENE